jgi:hypothetical protein
MNIDFNDPLVLIISLTAMVMAIHMNTSWKLKRLHERIRTLEGMEVSESTVTEEELIKLLEKDKGDANG